MTSINSNTKNLDLYEKVNFLFKNYLGFPNTDKTKPFFEEVGVAANNYFYGTNIFLDNIPVSPDFNNGTHNLQSSLNISSSKYISGTTQVHTDTTGIIRRFTKIKLEKIEGTNRGYFCRDNSGNNLLADAIQFNKVTDINGNRPYLYELYDSNLTQLFPSAETGNWIFDVKNGVINFPDEITGYTVNKDNPPYLTFFKYIGRKGVSELNSSDINGLNDLQQNINLKITDLSENVYKKDFIDSSFNYLKTYTDNLVSGLDVKESVKLATIVNLDADYSNGTNGIGATLTSRVNELLIIDDISRNNINDRILVKNQDNKVENGIYVIKEIGSNANQYKLQRAVPDDEGRELTGGSFVFVEEGTKNKNNGYVFTNNGTPIIGIDDIEIAQFSGAGQLIMGDGLDKDGNIIRINSSIYNRFDNLDTSFNVLESNFDNRITNLQSNVDTSFNVLESNFDNRITNLKSNVDTSFNALESNFDSRITNLQTNVDTSFNVLESNFDNRITNLQSNVDTSFNNIYTKSATDNLFLKGITVKQISETDISKNSTHGNINTILFDYDTGFNVNDASAGEVKISLGSHWKDIQINGDLSITPVGEEALNLITGNGISIIGNSNLDNNEAKSLTFSLDAKFTDLSGVPSDFKDNRGKYLTVNSSETALEFVDISLNDVYSKSFIDSSFNYLKNNLVNVLDTLPSNNNYDDRLVIRTVDNTIHRYDASSNNWISVGGTSTSTNYSDYSQILNFDVLTYHEGNTPVLVNYYDNNTPITNWSKIVDATYEYLSKTEQIVISYNAFISFNSSFINSNVSGFGGKIGIMEWVICIDDDIINNSRSYVQVDLIEGYVNLKTIINFTNNDADVNINTNTIKITNNKSIKIYARSIFNNSDNLVKLHQTSSGLARPDNLEVASIGENCNGISCKNIVDYKTQFLDVSQEIITYSSKNSITDISDNWTSVSFYNNYKPPDKTKNIILRYSPFITFSDDTFLGIKGRNAIIEWVFKVGNTILPNSRQFIHLDLIEKYFTIETNIKIDSNENLSRNILNWIGEKTVKIFARSIYNSNNDVRLHISQLSSTVKKPNIEIISIAGCDCNGQLTTSNSGSSSNANANTNTSDDRIKHNEKNILNGIDIIEKLEPKYYIKTEDLYDEEHNFILNNNGEPIDSHGNKLSINYTVEAGLIAQDLYKIPELKHTVDGYENDFNGDIILPQNKPLKVKYNDIFVYTIQALKEVIEKNKVLENRIAYLEDKINS